MCQDRSLELDAEESVSVSELIIALAIVLIFFAFLYGYNLDGWLFNDDEGSFLYQAWRVSMGDVPYRDFLTSHWPLFLHTGGLWVKLWGADILALRYLTIGLMLATSVVVFMLAKSVLSLRESLLSMVIFLLNPQIFEYGRLYHPEAFYIFFGTLGVWVFVEGQRRNNYFYHALSGMILALATLYKPLAVLSLGGVFFSLLLLWGRERENRLYILKFALVVAMAYGFSLAVILGLIGYMIPGFFEHVFGLQFVQGRELNWGTVVLKNLIFLSQYVLASVFLFSFALPAILKGWKGDRRFVYLAAQLPTALAFLIFSRDLFSRLLTYLIPALVILFVLSIRSLRSLKSEMLFYPIAIFVLLIPWVLEDVRLLLRVDTETTEVIEFLEENLSEGNVLLSDYQSFNFFAQAPSTYYGAEISNVFTDGGAIQGSALISEIEQMGVAMVIVDVDGDHMAAMGDFKDFRLYLQQNFGLTKMFDFSGHRLEIYAAQRP